MRDPIISKAITTAPQVKTTISSENLLIILNGKCMYYLLLFSCRTEYNGFDLVITRLSSIYNLMPDSLTQLDRIRDLIKNTYNDENALHTYDGKLAYVNQFGDVDLWNGLEYIPTHYEDELHGGYDVYFIQLTQQEGTYDIYPDLMISRCPADSTEQVENVVSKVISFEPEFLAYKNEVYHCRISA
jgi:hypothetical protein